MPASGRLLAAVLMVLAAAPAAAGERLLVATASNFKPAMEELLALFGARHADADVGAVYASTGKLAAQIRAGAPYDLYFSAWDRFGQRETEARSRRPDAQRARWRLLRGTKSATSSRCSSRSRRRATSP